MSMADAGASAAADRVAATTAAEGRRLQWRRSRRRYRSRPSPGHGVANKENRAPDNAGEGVPAGAARAAGPGHCGRERGRLFTPPHPVATITPTPGREPPPAGTLGRRVSGGYAKSHLRRECAAEPTCGSSDARPGPPGPAASPPLARLNGPQGPRALADGEGGE